MQPNFRNRVMPNPQNYGNVPSLQSTPMPVGDAVKGVVVDAAGRAFDSVVDDVSQGNLPNMGKAASAAVGESNKQLVVKGVQQMKKAAKSRSGRKGRNKGKSGRNNNNGGTGTGDRIYMDSNNGGQKMNKMRQSWNPFDITPPGPKIDVSYQKDSSLLRLPYESQRTTGTNIEDEGTQIEVTLRTSFRAITNNVFDFGTNEQLKDASYRIFSELKQQVNTNTNGGNAQTRDVFTYAKFWDYIKTTTQCIMILAELESLSTWLPPYEESNLLLRDIKNLVVNDMDLLQSRNRLEDVLATLAYPRPLMDYYTRLFYTYKKSPVSGGVHQKMMSTQMLADLTSIGDGTATSPFSLVRATMSSLTNSLRANIDENAVITAFLLNKVEFNYISTRYKNQTIGYPCYDAEFNSMYDNLPFYWYDTTSSKRVDAYGYRDVNTDARYSTTIALPMDVDNVSVFTTSHLLNHWYDSFAVGTYDTSGFPFFGANKNVNFPDSPAVDDSSNFIVYTDANDPGYFIGRVNDSYKCITDHICTVNGNTAWNILPRGLNVNTYQASYLSCSTACVKLLYDMFGVKN